MDRLPLPKQPVMANAPPASTILTIPPLPSHRACGNYRTARSPLAPCTLCSRISHCTNSRYLPYYETARSSFTKGDKVVGWASLSNETSVGRIYIYPPFARCARCSPFCKGDKKYGGCPLTLGGQGVGFTFAQGDKVWGSPLHKGARYGNIPFTQGIMWEIYPLRKWRLSVRGL